VYKNVTAQPAKTSLLFFKIELGQVKIKLHTTTSNGF